MSCQEREPSTHPPIGSVGVIVKFRSTRALELGRDLVRWLHGRGVECFVEAGSGFAFEAGVEMEGEDICARVDLVVVLGGDGTLLHAATLIKDDTPILGVNMGHLGFMTEIKAEEVYDALALVLSGDYDISPRARLLVEVEQNGGISHEGIVLNDAVVNSAVGRTTRLKVRLDDKFVTEVRADGLIVSTPTGSTAYNMAAGGPIIYPCLGILVVTPICPQSLTHRSIVFPDHLTTEVALDHRGEAYLHMDGQKRVNLLPGAKVRVRRGGRELNLIQSPYRDYFKILRAKLKWGSSVT